jgi:DNA polymerase III epsilon subunit-like protein
MNYIVFDLEFNQYLQSLHTSDKVSQCPFEIIQIGALRLDSNYNTISSFNRLVKPSVYSHIDPFVTELTGITTDQLIHEDLFPHVYHDYIQFIGEEDTSFCLWGITDMKVLFKNVEYHQLDKKFLPLMYIDIQPYVSAFFNLPKTQLLSLQSATEALRIEMLHPFHNALNDAYYTAEIFKKLNSPSIQPQKYNPSYVKIRTREPKKVIDFEALLLQFEKMYHRSLTLEEQDMIKLAYKMGKTGQFLR